MSTLPLEVHEVLEEEYVSMYGQLTLPESGAQYTDEQILDPAGARRILEECKIKCDSVLEALNGLVAAASTTELGKLADSPCINEAGRAILEDYDDYVAGQSKERRAEINRRVVDDALNDAVRRLRDVRLDNVYGAVHTRARREKPRTAVCISGGGIRSATFALGVMQGLAGSSVLDKFDYLSTVSGGGYIGSWLSSWIRRNGGGATGVQEELQRADTALGAAADANLVQQTRQARPRAVPVSKIDPEPEPLRHLRAYSNYLSPKLGLFSGDTWTLAAHYIRNLLLNLLVLVPLLALALAAPRFFSWLLEFSAAYDSRTSTIGWAYAFAAFTTLGFIYLGQKRPVEQGQKAQKAAKTVTTDGMFLLWCVLPLTFAGTSLAVFWARVQKHLDLFKSWDLAGPAALALAGMTLVPYILYYRRYWKALPTERRAVFADSKKFRHDHLQKQGMELLSVLIAVAVTALLFILLAVKVFDKPILPVPTVEMLAPIDRAGQAAAPMAQLYVCFVVPLVLLVFFVQASIFVGLSSRHNEDSDREWWGRAGAWLVAASVLLAVFSAVAVFGPVAFYYAPVILASVGGGAGIIAALLGYSSKTPANDKQKQEGGATAKASGLASALTVPLFVVALLAMISLGSTWLIQQLRSDAEAAKYDFVQPDKFADKAMLQAYYTTNEPTKAGPQQLRTTPAPRVSIPALKAVAHLQTVQHTNWRQLLGFLAVGAVGFALSFCIGVNKFSMQALYRNRIVRAYLGASRYRRDPDKFTGFDENDNLQMWELQPELLWTYSFRDVKGFLAALQKPENKLGAWLWNELDEMTKKALTDGINDISTDALIQNLNHILLHEELTESGVAAPAWVAETSGKLGYSRLMRNRAMLDANFAQWIAVMAPPADADGAPPASVVRGPMHVLNMALNLTSGQELAWQQRKAESFTASPLHAGSLYLGYRCAREYGGDDGISLGTAVGISGAAANPNMGYSSSPLMAFLLTFFNVRLGAWLGNPGVHGQRSFMKGHPTTGLVPMLQELTGNSTDTSEWVNLSDGDHFENLALYEMVVRRCHRIVLSDGGCDPKCTFDDLGNAVRKIRTDLGVPIDIIGKIEMFPRSADGQPVRGQYVAFGKIRYSAIDKNGEDGDLIYLKPGIYESDYFPRDVYNYSQGSPDFPHESTSDQFFSESQFESYRALGRHVVNEICGYYGAQANPLPAVAAFVSLVRTQAASGARPKPEEVIAGSVDRVAEAIDRLGGNPPGGGGASLKERMPVRS